MSVGKLYMMELSPPCRAVLLTAKAIGIELEKVNVNMMKGEHKTPEFLKMNPAHSVPTYLDNDGTAIGESHAIMIYLVEKYADDDSLYPKDLVLRAAVNQRLHFDSGNVFALHGSIGLPMLMRQETGPNERQLVAAATMYEILNTFLDDNTWVAGTDNFTIADFSLYTSISAINIVAPMDAEQCGNIVDWMGRCEEIPFMQEVNQCGQEFYLGMLRDMLKGNYDFMEAFKDT